MRWLLLGVLLVVGGTIVAFLWARNWTPGPPPKLLIAKETTWFTGPLTEDGRVDWVAAVKAEAYPQGLADADNGAVELEESLQHFVGLLDFAAETGHADLLESSTDDPIDLLLDRVLDGAGDDALVELADAWVERNYKPLEWSLADATRPAFSSAPLGLSLLTTHLMPELGALDDLHDALRLRIAKQQVAGEFEPALADLAAASAFVSWVSRPITVAQLIISAGRDVALLDLLVRLARRTDATTAARLLAGYGASAKPWTGDAALRLALQGGRITACSELDQLRNSGEGSLELVDGNAFSTFAAAVPHADPNPLFRRIQATFDELERQLPLADVRTIRQRLTAFEQALAELLASTRTLTANLLGPLGVRMLPNQQLADLALDDVIHFSVLSLRYELRDWIHATARRDALLAELAARAGAPERRDSWLGERLIVAREADGTITVSGPLQELAREFAPADDATIGR